MKLFAAILLSLPMSSSALLPWPPASNERSYHLVDPVFTAYNSNGSINLNIIPQYLNMSIASGVDIILLGGSTAEWPSLTAEERLNILIAWRGAIDQLPAGARPQLLFHSGDVSISAAQYLTGRATEAGADAVLIVSPCIMKPSTIEGLVDTIQAIASKAPSLPAIYYHYPELYSVDFDMADFLSRAHSTGCGGQCIPNLAGVKFIDGDMKTLVDATGVAAGAFTLFNNDPLLAGMVSGSKGAISYTNIFPLVQKMRQDYENHDMAAARDLQRKVIEWDVLVNQFGGKSAARNLPLLFGKLDLGPPRAPLVGQTDAQLQEFKAALEAAGLLQ